MKPINLSNKIRIIELCIPYDWTRSEIEMSIRLKLEQVFYMVIKDKTESNLFDELLGQGQMFGSQLQRDMILNKDLTNNNN